MQQSVSSSADHHERRCYRQTRRVSLIIVVALFCNFVVPIAPPVGAASQPVVVVGPLVKVRPADIMSGSTSASILAAKNEFESFQIVIQGGSSGLQGLNVTLASPLTGATQTIPAANVTIYREEYYDVKTVSDSEGAPGLWPDALIPAFDPWYGEQRKAFPVNVPPNQNRVIWVDVLVP